MMLHRRLRRARWTRGVAALTVAATVFAVVISQPTASAHPRTVSAPRCRPHEGVRMNTRDARFHTNSDCTTTAVFSSHMNYRDTRGRWRKVDLAFRHVSGGYVADHNYFTVRVDRVG